MLQVITNIENDLKEFLNTKEEAHFTTANNRADNLLTHISSIPRIQSPEELTSLIEGVHILRKDVSSHLENIREKAETISSSLAAKISGMDTRLAQIEQVIETQKGRLDNVITDFQQRALSGEDEKKKSFDELLKTKSQEFKEFTNSNEETVNAAIKNIEKNLADTTARIEGKTEETLDKHFKLLQENEQFLLSKVEEAKKLVHVIGNIGVTGEFSETAKKERRAADRLRFSAIGFMVVAVIIILSIVFSTEVKGFDWKLVAFRLSASLILLLPAFYLARESTIHRKREQHNRKLALELASIDPYLELLPEDTKVSLKSELTQKFFGQPDIGI